MDSVHEGGTKEGAAEEGEEEGGEGGGRRVEGGKEGRREGGREREGDSSASTRKVQGGRQQRLHTQGAARWLRHRHMSRSKLWYTDCC